MNLHKEDPNMKNFRKDQFLAIGMDQGIEGFNIIC